MSHDDGASARSRNACLTTQDLYRYVALPPDDKESNLALELHLAKCERCRLELAEVLKMLHSEMEDGGEAPAPLSEAEIRQTVALIQEVVKMEEPQARRKWWPRWAPAAAAAVVVLGAALGVIQYYRTITNRSMEFYATAKAELEKVYIDRSPGDLRLDLPFRPAARNRSESRENPLKNAEVAFMQALALRRESPEIYLGLATVYLCDSRFEDARSGFAKVLDVSRNHVQALIGRGVAEYELASRAEDAVLRRNLLAQAIDDFDVAIREDSTSSAARYNRIWVLYDTGRHQEALSEIEAYLSRETDSTWADLLKELEIRMRLTKQSAIQEEVTRSARERDQSSLETIARLIPDQAAMAIRYALKTSLRQEGQAEDTGKAGSTSLVWAAEIMEKAYADRTGDRSWKALLEFYRGLSPAQRAAKASLDRKLDELAALLLNGPPAAVLKGSEPLESAFSGIGDLWQHFNVHHLRGNSFNFQADFEPAVAEYREMLQLAERLQAPELQVKALLALASVYAVQMRPDELQDCAERLEQLAEHFGFDAWKATASHVAGGLNIKLNRLERSIQHLTAALGFAYRSHDEEKLVNLLDNLYLLMDLSGRSEDAKIMCAEAVAMMVAFEKEAGQPQSVMVAGRHAHLLNKQGEFALRADDLDQAEICFKNALALQIEDMRELKCRILIGLSQVHLGRRNWGDSERLLDESLALAVSGKYPELEWQASFLKGKMYEERGETEAALDSLSKSIATLERMRSRIVSGDLRQQFLARRFDPYKEIVPILYHVVGDERRALEFVDRAKSMTLCEYLNIPLDDGAREDADFAGLPEVLSIDYFFTADDLLAFVGSSGHNRIVDLKCSRPELESEIGRFLDSVRNEDEGTFDIFSAELYQKLIAPILTTGTAARPQMLLIFPDGPLHLLPFGGLRNSQNRFLLEDYIVSYAPSRDVLRHCLSRNKGSATSPGRSMLLIAGTADLAGAGDEIQWLEKLYQGSGLRKLTGRNLAAAAELAADAEIIHFAGHAALTNGEPALMLEDKPQRMAIDRKNISSWQLQNNRLVTLAGCETGIGPQSEGEVPWGLIPAFLNAGAPAVIVSLLPVSDESTWILISRFYDLLAKGSTGKASALREAQLYLLYSARATGRINPASWLPYVLIGDPR